MASWSELLREADASANPIDFLNKKRIDFLSKISEHTGRNVITYYSSWLTKSQASDIDINDSDKMLSCKLFIN